MIMPASLEVAIVGVGVCDEKAQSRKDHDVWVFELKKLLLGDCRHELGMWGTKGKGEN
jgi:hypothetical protein